MNNEPSDKDIQSTPTQGENSLFATRRGKALLFLGTLILALFIAGIVNPDDAAWDFWYIAILAFPDGLGHWDLAPLLWSLYIGIIVVGIRSKNSKLSRALFLIFVFLLILNIRGCANFNFGTFAY